MQVCIEMAYVFVIFLNTVEVDHFLLIYTRTFIRRRYHHHHPIIVVVIVVFICYQEIKQIHAVSSYWWTENKMFNYQKKQRDLLVFVNYFRQILTPQNCLTWRYLTTEKTL